MNKKSKIYVAGHNGLVGSALVRNLNLKGYSNLILRSRQELDLTRQADVQDFFNKEAPEYVFLAAAKVGGIVCNMNFQADFLFENLMIGANVINSAYQNNVKRLIYLGSSCVYPRDSIQPIKEDYLLSGNLEETNEGYAIAKIAGLKLCEKYRRQYGCDFLTVMPTNTFGPNDRFHPEYSHVIPGLIQRLHDAKIKNLNKVAIWGTGNVRREFMYVDDLAEALVLLMNSDAIGTNRIFNIGTGVDIEISELVNLLKKVVGYNGQIEFDSSKPEGCPRKVLNIDRILALGWKPETSLMSGLTRAYDWAQKNVLIAEQTAS